MLVHYDSLGYRNWATDVKMYLYSNGFGYVWELQSVPRPDLFLHNFEQRLKDQHIQNWSARCSSTSKLCHFVKFKTNYVVEKYICDIDNAKFRRQLARFRLSAHSLMIETGRYYGIPRDYRHCPYCEGCVEDEVHFLLVCPLYSDIREKYIDNSYYSEITVENFYKLMSSSNTQTLRKLAMFLYYASIERNMYID